MANEWRKIESPFFKDVNLEFKNDCVTHNSLKNFATQMGIATQTEAVVVDISQGYWLFKTKALIKTENYSRQVEEFGEAQESTLTTEIMKKYPAKMATKRSFDAAIISLICPIGPRLYSDAECPDGLDNRNVSNKPEVPYNPASQNGNNSGTPYVPPVQTGNAYSAPSGYPVQENVIPSGIMTSVPVQNYATGNEPVTCENNGIPENQESNTGSKEAGDYVIRFTEGFRGKTLKQIAAESGTDWIRFMASGRCQGFSDEEALMINEAIPYCKAFLDSLAG